MAENVKYRRKVLTLPEKNGLFSVPAKFGEEEEVAFRARRIEAGRVSNYADSKCGISATFDPVGAYLCGGRADGGSSPCNKIEGTECLIRRLRLTKPHAQSCGYWEVEDAGDREPRYSTEGKLGDVRISFGETANPEGFGCVRCEYGEGELPHPDSEGRERWCALKGFPVEDNACCAENEPDTDGESNENEGKSSGLGKMAETEDSENE